MILPEYSLPPLAAMKCTDAKTACDASMVNEPGLSRAEEESTDGAEALRILVKKGCRM